MNALEDGFGIVEGAISAERVDELAEYACQGLPGGLRWFEEVANSALLSHP